VVCSLPTRSAASLTWQGMRRYAVTMPREIPIPAHAMLNVGVTVSLFKTSQGWTLQVWPIGETAKDRLRPRWQAAYRITKKAMANNATVRDGCLVLAEELCLALDGWLEPAMFNHP